MISLQQEALKKGIYFCKIKETLAVKRRGNSYLENIQKYIFYVRCDNKHLWSVFIS